MSLWTIKIPKNGAREKTNKLAYLVLTNIAKNTKPNKMMKVGNFTPNCMPIKIAQMNTKAELLNWLLNKEESNKQEIIKEVKQKVNEL